MKLNLSTEQQTSYEFLPEALSAETRRLSRQLLALITVYATVPLFETLPYTGRFPHIYLLIIDEYFSGFLSSEHNLIYHHHHALNGRISHVNLSGCEYKLALYRILDMTSGQLGKPIVRLSSCQLSNGWLDITGAERFTQRDRVNCVHLNVPERESSASSSV
ncbi:unnamed protein product [Anisakis simplex]|uniref:Uncharacterized protein n=1 Tax=Anisakis simplex TaxID=6269 RepID=A0A0M3KE87_ANISI|nr:unnamed protein product [Anisakis simplex]